MTNVDNKIGSDAWFYRPVHVSRQLPHRLVTTPRPYRVEKRDSDGDSVDGEVNTEAYPDGNVRKYN